MSRKLKEPILDQGIRNVHFFNGRLLTANDLKAEQVAGREQRRHLGSAVGEGVVSGLEVVLESPGSTTADPVVAVTKGLALNRTGHVLSLPGDERVTIARRLEAAPPEAGLFAHCDASSQTFTGLQNGVYLLTLAPASGFAESAPMRGHRPSDTVSGCGSRYAVEGVQFNLTRIDFAALSNLGPDAPAFNPSTLAQVNTLLGLTQDLDRSLLRNVVAHLCFGTEQLTGVAREPFRKVSESAIRERSFYSDYGVADALRKSGAITDCDVPLAVIHWTGGVIRFVDMWSVRRRVYAPAGGRLSHLFTARRISEAEAMFFQFEEHLGALLAALPTPQTLNAANAFRWLPPAGLVPLRNNAFPAGAAHGAFFLGKSFGPPTTINGAKLRTLFDESRHYPPVDLAGTEFVQLYTVRESAQAQGGQNPPQPYVVFATQEMPYYSEQPRFANLCQTLRETRAAYRDLILRNVFLANATTFGRNLPSPALSLTARLTVTAALQSVMNSASERFTTFCRCGCAISHEKGLAVMQDLYDVQKSLVAVLGTSSANVFSRGLTNVINSGFNNFLSRDTGFGNFIDAGFTNAFDQNTFTFATLLNTYLDTAIPGTAPNNLSLRAAIQAQNLGAAIRAQNAINGLALNWSGEAVTGSLQVAYRSSDRGLTLVAGDPTPFHYTFRVTNMTNRPLDVQVSAAFDAPSTSWNSGVSLRDTTGAPVSSVTLEPFSQNDPNNPAAFRDVVVAVITPQAAFGSTGTLRFHAEVPPPVGVFDDATPPQPLVIGDAAAPESSTTVTFLAVSFTGIPASAPVGDEITYTFNFRFHTTEEPTTRSFRFFIDIGGAATGFIPYTIRFGNRQSETDPAVVSPTRRATRPFTLTSDADDFVVMHVIPQTGSPSAPLNFTARIQSTDDNELRDETAQQTITANPN
ncbi:MAG TPA: hypothetical protein VF064_06795 [Pyrinomonadaceae bacterium]